MYIGYPLLPDLTLKSPINDETIVHKVVKYFVKDIKNVKKFKKNRNDGINTKKFD